MFQLLRYNMEREGDALGCLLYVVKVFGVPVWMWCVFDAGSDKAWQPER